MENIYIGSDHAGFEYKVAIIKHLDKHKFKLEDVGPFNMKSVDYPDYAHKVVEKVTENLGKGILICGSGNGMVITANKHKNIRAALAWNKEITALSRQHNDANILCLPARFIDLGLTLEMVGTFLTTAFENGRHQRRLDKI